MTTKKLVGTAILLAGLGTACGGSGNSKLSSRVSQAHLAPVRPADRASEASAKQEVFLAEWQVAYGESQVRAAKLDIDIAKNNLASAKLTLKNAKLEREAAEESSDQRAIAETKQAEKVAELQIEVLSLTIDREKQSKRYLEERLKHDKLSLRSREASVELARANSLESAGIKPPDFDTKKYKTQNTERAANEKAAKASVDAEKAKLAAVEKQLMGKKNAVAAAEGSPVPVKVIEASKPMEALEGDPPEEQPKAEESTPAEDNAKNSEDENKSAAPEATEPAVEGAEPASETKTPPVPPSQEPQS